MKETGRGIERQRGRESSGEGGGDGVVTIYAHKHRHIQPLIHKRRHIDICTDNQPNAIGVWVLYS